MPGSATPPPEDWLDLVDPATDSVVGQVTRRGEVRAANPEIAARVRAAFARDLLVRDDAIADELGVCFADIGTLTPDDPAHADLVLRSLHALTGLVPRRREGR